MSLPPMTPDGASPRFLQSQKLEVIGQLAAGVAHEINTPSQYVSDNLRFLGEAFETLCGLVKPEPGSDAASALDYLRSEVPAAIEQSLAGMSRISEIVRGIKTFAHPGTGARSACDLNEMLQTTVAVSRNEWKYVAEVELDLEPGLPAVWAFSDELHHVFLNLLVNAAQALAENRGEGDPRGRIRIASRTVAAGVEIRIEDDGPGVPAGLRERIFDPFFTTKPEGKGTGQGLAICCRVVEHHEGTIRLLEGIGSGAAFVITLPLGQTHAQAA